MPRFSTFFRGFSDGKSIKIHFSTSPGRETGLLTPQEGLRASKITWEHRKIFWDGFASIFQGLEDFRTKNDEKSTFPPARTAKLVS